MNQPLTIRVFGRRRNVLLDKPYQHRVSMMTALMALLPPALFFGIYSLITSEGARRIVEASPELEEMVQVQNRTQNLMILAAVLFYGIGVYLVTLLESHRTAGFVHRVNRHLKNMASGQYHQTMAPRKDDHFLYLAETINRLNGDLRRRAEEDATTLGALREDLDDALLGLGSAVDGRSGQKLDEVRSRLEALQQMKVGQLEPAAPGRPHVVHVSDSLHEENQRDTSPRINS